jgi:hypothetical protein
LLVDRKQHRFRRSQETEEQHGVRNW